MMDLLGPRISCSMKWVTVRWLELSRFGFKRPISISRLSELQTVSFRLILLIRGLDRLLLHHYNDKAEVTPVEVPFLVIMVRSPETDEQRFYIPSSMLSDSLTCYDTYCRLANWFIAFISPLFSWFIRFLSSLPLNWAIEGSREKGKEKKYIQWN